MKSTCFYCNRTFEVKPVNIPKPENYIHAQAIAFGTLMNDNVCDSKERQATKQYECDQFDTYRKGE